MSYQNSGFDAVSEMAKARKQRNDIARELMGDLLDLADVFIWHTERWLTECVDASPSSDMEVMTVPEVAKAEALASLSCIALHSVQAVAESCRIGNHHPLGWLQRKLYETRTNALFIAVEPTEEAGQRWLHYGCRKHAKLWADQKAAQDAIRASKVIFPDADLEKENGWAVTVDEMQAPKKCFDLVSRANYVEKTQSTEIPDEIKAMRAGIAEYEIQMVRRDNMVVHPSVTGTDTGPNSITALYSAVQWTWDTVRVYSDYLPSDQRMAQEMVEAHDKFANAILERLFLLIAEKAVL